MPVNLDVLSLNHVEWGIFALMDFLNEAWFWSGFFVFALALVNLLFQEWLRPKNQAQIERLKLYDSEILAAHKSLYSFVSTMWIYFAPSEDARKDFIYMMKGDFSESVKPNMLLFSPKIREILSDFDAQYHCIGDPDLNPKIPFDEFIDKHLPNKLSELEKLVEKTFDSAMKKLR